MVNGGGGRKDGEGFEHFSSMSYATAGDFTDGERVTYHQVVVQQPSESGRISTKVVDPHDELI